MYKSISFGTFCAAKVMTIVRLPKIMVKNTSQTIGANPTSSMFQTGSAPIENKNSVKTGNTRKRKRKSASPIPEKIIRAA